MKLGLKNILWTFSSVICLELSVCSCSSDLGLEPLDEAAILTEIKLNVTNPLPLLVGTDSTISYTLIPEYATSKEVEWSSDNESIAKVDQNGCITAVNIGETNIRVKSKVGYVANSVLSVSVIDKIIEVTDIKILPTTPEVFATASLQLDAEITPDNATYKTLKWYSLTPDIASITEDGLLTGIVAGTAKVKAVTTDGSGFSKEFDVKIKEIVPVESITFTQQNNELALNDNGKLSYTVSPVGATVQSLSWTSSDETVITVDNEGNYKALAYGDARITASTPDGKASAYIDLSVVKGKLNDYGEIFNKYTSNGNGVIEINEKDELVMKLGTGKKNAQIARGKTLFSPNYPILAIKAKAQSGVAYTKFWHNISITVDKPVDYRYDNFVVQDSNPIDLKDGTRVYYINIYNGGELSGEVEATRFTIDTGYDGNGPFGEYTLCWIKTFKSESEMKSELGID